MFERSVRNCVRRRSSQVTKTRRPFVPKKKTIESYLPLTPAVFHVLLSLADGEKHGYVISKEIARRTNNEVRLSAGTLYGIIKRLLEDGFIEESEDRPDFSLDDQRRRYYRLTKLGGALAEAEAERMERVLAMARAKRVIGPESA
jgi:DNA-binding PadR family transcriptional regulator